MVARTCLWTALKLVQCMQACLVQWYGLKVRWAKKKDRWDYHWFLRSYPTAALDCAKKSFMTTCGGVFSYVFTCFHTSGRSITADPLARAPLKLLPHFASKRFCHECWPKLIEQVEVYVFHDVSDFFPAPLGQTMTSAEASLPWLEFEALKL